PAIQAPVPDARARKPPDPGPHPWHPHRDQWAIAVRGLLPGGHGHRRRRPGLRRRRFPPPLSPRGKNSELCLLGTRQNRRGGLLPARDQDRLYLERGLFRCPAGPDLLGVDQEDDLVPEGRSRLPGSERRGPTPPCGPPGSTLSYRHKWVRYLLERGC